MKESFENLSLTEHFCQEWQKETANVYWEIFTSMCKWRKWQKLNGIIKHYSELQRIESCRES